MIKTVSRLTLLVIAAALVLLAQPVSSQNGLTITDLGTLVGPGRPTDVNDEGYVVGSHRQEGAGVSHFLVTPEKEWVELLRRGRVNTYVNELNQVATNLFIPETMVNPIPVLWDGDVTTPGDIGGGYGLPRDINETGQVAGELCKAEWQYGYHAFLWTPQDAMGAMLDLGTLGGMNAFALAMNNSGWVVGDSDTDGGEIHAFLWRTSSEGMVDLLTLGGTYSTAADVNDLGVIVGTSTTTAGEYHACLWTKDGEIIDLDLLLGGSYSGATDINELESPQVVGYSSTASGAEHAFLWTESDGMIDIGTLGGGAGPRVVRINNSGQVVGNTSLATGESRGFLWTPSTGMMELGTLTGGAQTYVVDINENGQAVGWSDTATGERHVVLWALLSPAEQISHMLNSVLQLVDEGLLKQASANALVQKLENALRQLEAQNTNAACGQLQAFVNQVEAYTKTEKLPQEEGTKLIEAASSVMDQVCG